MFWERDYPITLQTSNSPPPRGVDRHRPERPNYHIYPGLWAPKREIVLYFPVLP